MLFKTKISFWGGVGREDRVIVNALGTDYVLNINKVSNLKTFGTGSEFLYTPNATDRKAGYSKVICDTPVATIRDEYDVDPTSSVLTLSVFTNSDLNKPLFTTYISIYDFAYAWSHNPYPQYTWLVYCMKGGKEKRVLVNMGLVDLLYYDTPSGESNIQWFVFVDPNEEIVLTKLIVA